jgi:hypothetical protein
MSFDSKAARGESHLLKACASPSNTHTIENLLSKDGELFDGHGTRACCHSRLCPSCSALRKRRIRAGVREGIERGDGAARAGDRWRFITLTTPTFAGVELQIVRSVVNRAWRLFMKRTWYESIARAGVKGEEYTLGDERRIASEGRAWSLGTDGYHFHIHLLLLCGFVDWKRLGEEWTESLTEACRAVELQCDIRTAHGRAVVDVRQVVDKKKRGRFITTEGAINEVCKYLTKHKTFLQMPDAELLKLIEMKRWSRSVELLGECRKPRAKETRPRRTKAERAAFEEAARGAELMPVLIEARLQALKDNGEQRAEQRDARGRVIRAGVDDFDLERQARSELSVCGALEWKTVRAVIARTSYLDTENLIFRDDRERQEAIFKRRTRANPLRELLRIMDYERWCEMVDEYFFQVREWRKTQLARRYPYATFRTLAGEVWHGVEVLQVTKAA